MSQFIMAALGLAAVALSGRGPVLVSRDHHHDVLAHADVMSGPARAPSADDGETMVSRAGSSTFGAEYLAVDPVLQATGPRIGLAAPILAFEGIGDPSSPNVFPPDANGDVGLNHYVEVVNYQFAVYSKQGQLLLGPLPMRSLWKGFSGPCEEMDGGDPLVVYDSFADRWLLSNQSGDVTQPGQQCIAVSQTPDPTGGWFRYQFSYPSHNSASKLAVWPGAYLLTTGLLTTAAVPSSPRVCALDRSTMLTGRATTQQCFETGNYAYAADPDGALPPAGAPGYVVQLRSYDALSVSSVDVDWQTPANSRLAEIGVVPVASWSDACSACVSQPGTTQVLGTLGGVILNRVTYRNFGNREAILVSHPADANGVVGLRWYELQVNSASRGVTLRQQGTFGPGDAHRWMGSAALDKFGNLAIAYNISSGSIFPSIAIAGRLAGDVPGLLTLGETIAYPAAGSQSSSGRWGDYSSLQVDPVDDCTFWSTAPYAAAFVIGAEAFAGTRITVFRLPGCGAADTFSLTVAPAIDSVRAGGSISFSIGTAVTSGASQSIALTVENLPADIHAEIRPSTLAAGQTAELLLSPAATAIPRTIAFTMVGTGEHSRGVAIAHLGIMPPADSAPGQQSPRSTPHGCASLDGLPWPIALLSWACWIRRRRK